MFPGSFSPRRAAAILSVSVCSLLGVMGIVAHSFVGELLWRSAYLTPYRTGGNWVQVILTLFIFAVAFFLRVGLLDHWQLDVGKTLKSVGISVLAAAIGWMCLFCYSLMQEIHGIREVKIQAPRQATPRLPWNWDQKSVPPRDAPLEGKITKPNLKGNIENVAFLPSEPRKNGCHGSVTVIAVDIRNDGAPSIVDVGPISAVLPSGRRIELIRMAVPFEGIGLIGAGVNSYFPAKDWLPKKAFEQPIPTNGAVWGWTWGCADNVPVEEINNLASKISISFSDITGRQYTARVNLSDKQIKVLVP